MAIDNTKIHQGTGRIFYNVTAPASSLPPTWLAHTSGVPNVGTPVDIGATEGDMTFSYVSNKDEIYAEQELAPIDVVTTDEQVVLSFTIKELNYTALKAAFEPSVGNLDDGTKTGFYVGGGSAILAPFTGCWAWSSIQRNAPTKFILGVIYKGYTKIGAKMNVGKKNETVIQVEVHGLADLSRSAGDRVAQWYREK